MGFQNFKVQLYKQIYVSRISLHHHQHYSGAHFNLFFSLYHCEITSIFLSVSTRFITLSMNQVWTTIIKLCTALFELKYQIQKNQKLNDCAYILLFLVLLDKWHSFITIHSMVEWLKSNLWLNLECHRELKMKPSYVVPAADSLPIS